MSKINPPHKSLADKILEAATLMSYISLCVFLLLIFPTFQLTIIPVVLIMPTSSFNGIESLFLRNPTQHYLNLVLILLYLSFLVFTKVVYLANHLIILFPASIRSFRRAFAMLQVSKWMDPSNGEP